MEDALWKEEIDRVSVAMAAACGSRKPAEFQREAACFVAGMVTLGVFTAGMHGLDPEAPARELEAKPHASEGQQELGLYRGLAPLKSEGTTPVDDKGPPLDLTRV